MKEYQRVTAQLPGDWPFSLELVFLFFFPSEDDYLGILWGVNDTSKSLKQDFSDKEPFHLPVVQGPPSKGKVFVRIFFAF